MHLIDKIKLRLFFTRARVKNEFGLFIEDTKAVCRPWFRRPGSQAAVVAYVLRQTFIPHEDNNRFQKVIVSAFSLVWIAAFLGVTFGDASPPVTTFTIFTAFVFALIGSVIGIEWDRLDPVTISFGGDDAGIEISDDEGDE